MNEISASAHDGVASLHERIARAVHERQDLRAAAAGAVALEDNRLEIARLQRLLSLALIRSNAAAVA